MADYLPTSIKNLNTKLGEQLTDGGGGGGSSDFSTAEVTVVNNSSGTIDIVGLPIGTTAEGMSMTVAVLPRLEMGTSAQVKVPLYQGACLWLTAYFDEYYRSVSFTAVGNATVSETGVAITGDCTITIS